MADSLAQLLAGLDLNKEGALALVLEAARRSDEAVREAQDAVRRSEEARRKARQGEFLANMRAISSSSSVDIDLRADERRGAPAPRASPPTSFLCGLGLGTRRPPPATPLSQARGAGSARA
jgi:hypothetical protein